MNFHRELVLEKIRKSYQKLTGAELNSLVAFTEQDRKVNLTGLCSDVCRYFQAKTIIFQHPKELADYILREGTIETERQRKLRLILEKEARNFYNEF